MKVHEKLENISKRKSCWNMSWKSFSTARKEKLSTTKHHRSLLWYGRMFGIFNIARTFSFVSSLMLLLYYPFEWNNKHPSCLCCVCILYSIWNIIENDVVCGFWFNFEWIKLFPNTNIMFNQLTKPQIHNSPFCADMIWIRTWKNI